MKPREPLPDLTVAQLLQAISKSSTKDGENIRAAQRESEKERIELEGRRQFFKLRGRWSSWLIWWISLILLFQAALTLCIGFGFLDFAEYQWFLNGFLGQSFLQIIGMGFVIINFLYPKNK